MRDLGALHENELLALLRQGDRAAFERIYYLHYPALYRFIVRTLSSKDDATEVLQDVFVKLWELRARLNITSTLSGYLFAMTRNQVLQYAMKSKKQLAFADQYSREQEAFTDLHDVQLDEQYLRRVLNAHIEKLPEIYRKTLQLRLQQNLSEKEIAASLNMNRDTVKKQYQRAVKLLQASLKVQPGSGFHWLWRMSVWVTAMVTAQFM